MDRLLKGAWAVAALAVAAFFASATWMLWRAPNLLLHADGTLTRAEAVLSKVNASAVNLDRATQTWADSSAAQAQSVERLVNGAHDSLSNVDLTLASIRSNSDTLNQNLASLRRTTDAATDLSAQARVDLQTLNASISATGPLLAQYTQAGKDLDARLTDPNLAAFEYHLAGISINADKVTGDFESRFHDLLYPPPCHSFGCKFSRYAWPVVKDGAAFGSTLYWTRALVANQSP